MEFEWDENKRQIVLAQRGVDFEVAALIFEGRIVTVADNRREYGEERLISVGEAEGVCYAVVYTRRGDATRIISAWKLGRRERAAYYARIARGTP
jgi:uncharacterized protein